MMEEEDKVYKYGEFNPDSVHSKNRFFLDFRPRDCWYKYIGLIYGCRVCATYEGTKYCLKYGFVMRTGNVMDYEKDGHFMIISVLLKQDLAVDFVVFKPNLYVVAAGVNGVWGKVSDFTEVTGYTFSSATQLRFKSSYRSVPKKFSFDIIANALYKICTEIQSKNWDFGSEFKHLCVFIAESIRFDTILKIMIRVLHRIGEERVLDDVEEWLVHNWEDISSSVMLYDLGYSWNENMLRYIPTPDKIPDIIGVLKYAKFSTVISYLKKRRTSLSLKALDQLIEFIECHAKLCTRIDKQNGVPNPHLTGKGIKAECNFIYEWRNEKLK